MKFSIASCITIAVAALKVSADCFSTSLGYPCCPSNTKVEYTDSDGQWGIYNNNWCGIGGSVSQATNCTGENQGYSCCNSCNVSYTDNDGDWGIENGQWCGIRKTCGQQQVTTVKKTTTTTKAAASTNLPDVTGGLTGKTTRYWDCCVASCSWSENTKAPHPVNVCQKDGQTVIPNFDWRVKSVCDGGSGYMCNDNQPWVINDQLSYGFAAASLSTGAQKDWCCSCQRLQFTSGPVKGKQMIVQVTNTGGDLGQNHFDIQIPGGGVGIFNGCSNQWGAGNDGWGQRYGGVSSSSACSSLPAELQSGCKWRFDWFKNSDNPTVTFERVQCPKELTDISGCIPVDDASQKQIPW